MIYGVYGGHTLFGLLVMIIHILVFVAIIWLLVSLFTKSSRDEHASRLSYIEKVQDENRELLDKIFRKLDQT